VSTRYRPTRASRVRTASQFVDNVVNPKAIGFGTIDDIDQVAAKRSDDRASAGQHEVTAVLMESFAGARRWCAAIAPSACSPTIRKMSMTRCASGPARAGWSTGRRREDDYIDIFVLLAGKNHSIPLGDHDLYASAGNQEGRCRGL
jgi:hypothetical protein